VKRTILCVLVAVVLAAGSFAHADAPFDPAARAKVIAPFIEEETVAVIHVDFSRIDVDAVAEQLVKWVPGAFGDGWDPRFQKATLAVISEAGIREMYLVVTLAGALRAEENLLFAVVPLPADVNRYVPAHELRQAEVLREKMDAGHYFTAFARRNGVLLAGTRETVDRLKRIQPDVRPELEKAFEAAGDTTAQVLLLPPKHTVRAIREIMPELPEQLGGGPSDVLTRGCLWAAVGIDLPPKTPIRAVVQSADHEAAKAMLAKWKQFGQLLEQHKDIRRDIPGFKKIWQVLTPQVQGDRLVLVLDERNQGVARVMTLLKLPAMEARENARRIQSMNNLKQLGLSMHQYHDTHKAFPAAASYDKDGRPLLSWRVHILPYLNEGTLHKEFHLDEPWDSPHNKKLIEKMPAVYRSSASKLSVKGRTNYVVATGPGTVFDGNKGMSYKDITDGMSLTIMVVEADDTHAPIWTKPEDLPFDPNNPKRGLGGLRGDYFLSTFCDGSAHALSPAIDPETLRRLFLRNDGKLIDYKKLHKR